MYSKNVINALICQTNIFNFLLLISRVKEKIIFWMYSCFLLKRSFKIDNLIFQVRLKGNYTKKLMP